LALFSESETETQSEEGKKGKILGNIYPSCTLGLFIGPGDKAKV